jgi:hypothetical protein
MMTISSSHLRMEHKLLSPARSPASREEVAARYFFTLIIWSRNRSGRDASGAESFCSSNSARPPLGSAASGGLHVVDEATPLRGWVEIFELKRLKPQSNGTHAAGEIALDH